MVAKAKSKTKKTNSNSKLFSFLFKFKKGIGAVIVLSLVLNLIVIYLPKISARIINDLSLPLPKQLSDYQNEQILLYAGLITLVFVLSFIQNIYANIVSEKVAAELRRQIVQKVSNQSFSFVQKVTVQKLLTNLTSDVDAIKQLVAQGSVIVFSSIVLLFGSAISLLTINWQLALPVISAIPILFISFGFIFSRISKYFIQSQEIIDALNKVINETIIGAGLIRVLNSGKYEEEKFGEVNAKARFVGVKIVNGFATLIPFINFVANAAVLIVVGYGGSKIIDGTLNPGDYAAFFTYIGTFVAPIIFIGFLSSIFTRAFASYVRILEVLEAKNTDKRGDVTKNIEGEIKFDKVSRSLGNRQVLKDISFEIKPKTRTAIIGPTAAGKTQIFYLISGLLRPETGKVTIDGTKITDYNSENFYSQLGLVFQDSIIFNTTLRENVAFSEKATNKSLEKALETAEMLDFANSLENNLDTKVAERGASLSGGQKQRLTLARALSINPKVLLLDDFTARVDIKTERKIFANIAKNYPETTLISITQKIEPVVDFDQIILIMEGELIAKGTHKELLKKSFEYRQIYSTQQSTEE